ncbi:hypothetical protein PENTCL1PPCAC_24015, partial [Pristionchus entomophagus]
SSRGVSGAWGSSWTSGSGGRSGGGGYHVGHSGVGSGPRSYGHVYGYHHHVRPVYMHGGYSPLVISPFYGCYYCYGPTWGYGFMTGDYVAYNNYHYYSHSKYLPKDTKTPCTRPASDLPTADLEKLKNATSETPKNMAWACPESKVCCGWECCEDPEAQGLPWWAWMLIGFGIFFGVLILIGLGCWIYSCIRLRREHEQAVAGRPVSNYGTYEAYPMDYGTPPPVYSHGGYGTYPMAYGTY